MLQRLVHSGCATLESLGSQIEQPLQPQDWVPTCSGPPASSNMGRVATGRDDLFALGKHLLADKGFLNRGTDPCSLLLQNSSVTL